MSAAVRHYALVTLAYWAFTLTDGALRMLVLLHFHARGYGAVQLAFLFVLYELCGVVTNLLGGWIAARTGLKVTLSAGLALQAVALGLLSLVGAGWAVGLSVAYVMGTQALSGVAKDLTKMSAKSSLKVLVPPDAGGALFKWVALLTGSKNALKGVGFFLGGLLLSLLGFEGALWAMAAALAAAWLMVQLALPGELGRAKVKPAFRGLLSRSPEVNVLSAARFFLFGARDVWFVVGVPVFLAEALGWGFTEVGSFLALWVVGYGAVQSLAPALLRGFTGGGAPGGRSARVLALLLAGVMGGVALSLRAGASPGLVLGVGLGLFGVVFALNSSVHSYLILAYSEGDKVALNVGFYYMANAGGRLVGTLLSGLTFQLWGVQGCLWASLAFALATAALSLRLPQGRAPALAPGLEVEAGGD
ncbi:organoarsenical effux MFS transporter ArsJ [Aggregicoccus sp. 17bor-14]|uniref:organoarsenical effux MFS transporter ArsJ n=1 Tax=Myxococcaceae TaxID=31 RepID=UPI00129C522E|nr:MULTISPECIES: organoarsenical effux MFS transporter ArsJ [Myxococcaceae]MBF5045886.1 organoarsenical effux MFS transporter ArsJ [Simulacricoccus sp. 17bor-14]MRI91620.1 organoarsenical effux MFS transporter ArsJ [Aggregicoccus sp. 17bor-14]